MSTPTTDVPAAGALPRLMELAAASREATELQWKQEQIERRARERNKAISDATHGIKLKFPRDLGHSLPTL